MRARDTAVFGDLAYGLENGMILLFRRSIHMLGEGIRLRTIGLFRFPVAREPTPRQRAPRDDADALIQALRQHLARFLAVEQIILRLHRHETRPAMTFGNILHLG